MSFEVDELIPVSRGGNPLDKNNLDAAHRCCNEWRSNKTVEEVRSIAAKEKSNFRKQVVGSVSRSW